MNRVVVGIFVGLMALASSGCGGNPLVGRWSTSSTSNNVSSTVTLALNGDGSASLSVAISSFPGGSCTGARTYTGFKWTSAMDTLTTSGTPVCTGVIACTAAGVSRNFDCSDMTMAARYNGACTYMLSADNMSLTLSSCSGDSGTTTYTRDKN